MEWERQNGQSEVEAIIIKRLVLQGEPGVGAAVQMQYRGEIWNGQILSLHGKTNSFICIHTCI